MSEHFSLRFQIPTAKRLKQRARHVQLPPRTLAQRYVEEGLRHDDHPLVHFVDGPAGRRPALLGTGLDVWEVIATVRDNDGDQRAAADYLGIPPALVQAAVAYYGAYRDEIDVWIEDAETQARDAYDAWQAGQDAISAS